MSEKTESEYLLFSALAHPKRLQIVKMLSETDRPLHVKGIARLLKSDYAVTYRHIEKLKNAGLIGIHEVGRSRVPYLKNKEMVGELLQVAKNCMS